MVGERRYCYGDVLPFTAMVAREFLTVGIKTLYKAATVKGMSYHVFVVYSSAVAAFFLLPSPFFSFSSRELPPLNFSIISKIFLLGVIGCASQILGYTGISYSSPTLASAINTLVPASTFVLAIIFRMEKLDLGTRSSAAKVLGTTVSVSGALVVTLYKGPGMWTRSPHISLGQPLHSIPSSWTMGGLLLTVENCLAPMWYIVQAQIMKEYPAEWTVVFFYNLTVCMLAAVLGIFTEPDSSAWRIRPNIALVSMLCSGIFGLGVNNIVDTWALRLKGPFYVAMFKPLSIAIAVAMGVTLLGDTLYLGSVIGATIISVGFYTVMWGKSKEVQEDDNRSTESSSNTKYQLVQGNKREAMEGR